MPSPCARCRSSACLVLLLLHAVLFPIAGAMLGATQAGTHFAAAPSSAHLRASAGLASLKPSSWRSASSPRPTGVAASLPVGGNVGALAALQAALGTNGSLPTLTAVVGLVLIAALAYALHLCLLTRVQSLGSAEGKDVVQDPFLLQKVILDEEAPAASAAAEPSVTLEASAAPFGRAEPPPASSQSMLEEESAATTPEGQTNLTDGAKRIEVESQEAPKKAPDEEPNVASVDESQLPNQAEVEQAQESWIHSAKETEKASVDIEATRASDPEEKGTPTAHVDKAISEQVVEEQAKDMVNRQMIEAKKSSASSSARPKQETAPTSSRSAVGASGNKMRQGGAALPQEPVKDVLARQVDDVKGSKAVGTLAQKDPAPVSRNKPVQKAPVVDAQTQRAEMIAKNKASVAKTRAEKADCVRQAQTAVSQKAKVDEPKNASSAAIEHGSDGQRRTRSGELNTNVQAETVSLRVSDPSSTKKVEPSVKESSTKEVDDASEVKSTREISKVGNRDARANDFSASSAASKGSEGSVKQTKQRSSQPANEVTREPSAIEERSFSGLASRDVGATSKKKDTGSKVKRDNIAAARDKLEAVVKRDSAQKLANADRAFPPQKVSGDGDVERSTPSVQRKSEEASKLRNVQEAAFRAKAVATSSRKSSEEDVQPETLRSRKNTADELDKQQVREIPAAPTKAEVLADVGVKAPVVPPLPAVSIAPARSEGAGLSPEPSRTKGTASDLLQAPSAAYGLTSPRSPSARSSSSFKSVLSSATYFTPDRGPTRSGSHSPMHPSRQRSGSSEHLEMKSSFDAEKAALSAAATAALVAADADQPARTKKKLTGSEIRRRAQERDAETQANTAAASSAALADPNIPSRPSFLP